MKRHYLPVSLVLLLTAFASSARAEKRVERDLAYKTSGSDYELERCKLDLYLPEGEGFPVVVWFHGGGLTTGAKDGETDRRVAQRLVDAGIGCANVNYRLSPKAKFPAYVEDAAAAVAWVAKNIGKYGGDPEALFVSGHSAGGYLTAILGVDPQYLAAHGMSPNELSGLMPVSGQMSTHTTIQGERGTVSETRIVDAAAPLYHVENLGPTELIIAGTRDAPDREQVNRDYAKALQDAGHKDVTLLVVPGRTHGTIIELVDQPDDVVALAMLKFIRDRLPRQLEPVEMGETRPVHKFGDIWLAGQPSPEDLALFQQQGVETIINVRRAEEIDWGEAAEVERLGMHYVYAPFGGDVKLTPEIIDEVLTTLRDETRGPTLFHCASANRVGAIWYAYRVLDGGVSPEVAEREAKTVGLRNPEYLKKAQAYVVDHTKADPALATTPSIPP